MITCLLEGNFAEKGKLFVQNPLAWILPAFFLLHLTGVLYSGNTSNAWANIDKKIAFLIAPLIIVTANPFTKKELQQLAWIFVATCFAGTIICYANAISTSGGQALWNFGPQQPYMELHPGASPLWTYFSYMGLASGIGIHPTYFALYLYVCILIVMRLNNRMTLPLIAYFLIFIVLLSSRIVVLVSIFTLIIALANKKSWMIGVGALTLIAVILFINPVARYRNTQEYREQNFNWPPAAFSDNPISIRTSLWWLSLNAVREVNPLIGSGTGDVNDTMVALADKYDVHNVLNTSDPHNQYLHTFIALGALGLAMLLAVFMVPLRLLFRQREFLACMGLISFMCVCMTESALELQKGIILFTLFVSLTGNVAREWRFSTQGLKYA
ncbi:MAG TPA: O-antigen ligase family protein [Cyclobacteriaceae bacterium]|nr:O-antigen ligase family protein [Cyclobacteriaceae bacterium]